MLRSICIALAILAVAAPGASAAVTSSFSSGTLTVSSDSAGDNITITCGSAAQVNNVNVAGSTCATVTTMTINGNGGADTIDLQSVSGTFPNANTITINGGTGTDFLIGSQRADTMNGNGDADTVYGNGGADTITTSDTVGDTDFDGGTGTDRIVVSGGLSDGVVVGPSSITTYSATIPHTGFEAATFNPPIGEPQLDLSTAPWPVTVNGNTGNETVVTGPFNDILNLGTQGIADVVIAKADGPNITIFAGGLNSSPGSVGNDTWLGVERAELISPSALGVPGAPVVNSVWDATAAGRPVVMRGGTGNDTMLGGSSGDTLGSASASPDEESGNDTFDGGPGSDTIRPGPGTDTLRKNAVSTNATATAASLTSDGETDNYSAGGLEIVSLTGNNNANILNASAFGGRAVLSGAGGNDTLTGSAQDDRLTGGLGDDSFNGGGGTDTLAESAGSGPSAAQLTPTQLVSVTFGGTEDINSIERAELTGNSDTDTFDASTFPGPVTLFGFDGADTLTGGLARDVLIGGAGTDTLNAQDGAVDMILDCGSEADIGNFDFVDGTGIGCETLNVTGTPDPDPDPDPDSDPAPGTGTNSATALTGGTTVNAGPTVTDSRAPALAITAGRVDRRGRVPVRFACPADETSCAGTFQLRTKRGKKTITVGRGKFSAPGGEIVPVRTRLNAAARKLLRQRGRIKLTVVGSAADAAGNATRLNKSLTVKPAPRRRR